MKRINLITTIDPKMTMCRIVAIALSLLAVGGIVASAERREGAVLAGELYYVLNEQDSTAMVTYDVGPKTGNYRNLTSVEIPDTITVEEKRYAVTAIDDYTFNYNNSIQSVTIPETVTNIGSYAFYSCKGLKNIDIPDGVTTIAPYTFDFCSGLTTVSLPKNLVEVGDYAFGFCYQLQEVSLSETVTTIGKSAFSSCEALHFTLPSSLTSIGGGAFSNTAIDAVVIPDGIAEIPYNCFFGCKNLTSLTMPNTITSIGRSAFQNCISIESITLPSSLTAIETMTFRNCTALKSITIPGGVTVIKSSTFAQCENLRNLILSDSDTPLTFEQSALPYCPIEYLYLGREIENPGDLPFANTVTCLVVSDRLPEIPEEAFANYSHLHTLYLPYNLRSIGKDAFYGCNSLAYIHCYAQASPSMDITLAPSFPEYVFSNAELKIPAEALPLYVESEWVKFKNISFLDEAESLIEYTYGSVRYRLNPNTATATVMGFAPNAESAFLTLPDYITYEEGASNIRYTVEGVEAFAFQNRDLNAVGFPITLKYIGRSAFEGNRMRSVTLPPYLERVGACAFKDNVRLTDIAMGYNVKQLGAKAFYNCEAAHIAITTAIPPMADNSVFSNYLDTFMVSDGEVMDAYKSSASCWHQFTPQALITPRDVYMDTDELCGRQGESVQLTVTLEPADVSLPQLFWQSTNPDVATVDPTGLVTFHTDMHDILADAAEENSCVITAETLYADAPVAEIRVGRKSVINEVKSINPSQPMSVYSLNGVYVADSLQKLPSGLYIVKQEGRIFKVIQKSI